MQMQEEAEHQDPSPRVIGRLQQVKESDLKAVLCFAIPLCCTFVQEDAKWQDTSRRMHINPLHYDHNNLHNMFQWIPHLPCLVHLQEEAERQDTSTHVIGRLQQVKESSTDHKADASIAIPLRCTFAQ
jgi:hypothetical protein